LSQIKTVLFDLDGTLIDTAPDMANALNRLLKEENLAEMSFESIRPVVSNGSVALVKLGFGDDIEAETLARLKTRYLDIYQQHLCEDSVLFDGMAQLLNHIEQNNMNWGVVTNKPAWLTEPLIDALGLTERAACIVSGDTCENRKPHPEPILHGCQLAGSKAQDCVYIGDAQRDIESGNRAGMRTIVAFFGYIADNDKPEDWGADVLQHSPLDIQKWLNS